MAAYIKHTTFSAGFNSSVLPKKNDTEQADVFKAKNNIFTGTNTFTIAPNTSSTNFVIKNKDITGSGTQYNSEVDFQDTNGSSKAKISYDATNDRFELNKSLNLSSGSFLTAGSSASSDPYIIIGAQRGSNLGNVDFNTLFSNGYAMSNFDTTIKLHSTHHLGVLLSAGLWVVSAYFKRLSTTLQSYVDYDDDDTIDDATERSNNLSDADFSASADQFGTLIDVVYVTEATAYYYLTCSGTFHNYYGSGNIYARRISNANGTTHPGNVGGTISGGAGTVSISATV